MAQFNLASGFLGVRVIEVKGGREWMEIIHAEVGEPEEARKLEGI